MYMVTPPRSTFDGLLQHHLFCIMCYSHYTCAGNAVNIDKFRTVHMRFRFCLNGLSESVFCIESQ